MYPTLIITAGESAQRIVERAFRQIQQHFPDFIPGIAIMRLYRVLKVKFEPPPEGERKEDEGAGSQGANCCARDDATTESPPRAEAQPIPPPEEVTPEGLLHWLPFSIECEVEEPSPKDLRDAFMAAEERFKAHFPKLTKALLDAGNLKRMPDADASELHIFIIASLEEAEGVAWAPCITKVIHPVITQQHPRLNVRAQGIWLLPEGKHPFGAEIANALTQVSVGGGHDATQRPYSFVWLMTPINANNQRLSTDDLHGMCATLLLAHIVTGFAKWLWHPNTPFGEVTPSQANIIGSASAVLLEFPAEYIISMTSSCMMAGVISTVKRQRKDGMLAKCLPNTAPSQSKSVFMKCKRRWRCNAGMRCCG